MQDLGLARYLIKNFPDLPIHASTQMTIHNLDGALEAEKLGFKRVVLSREVSLEEVEYICKNTNVEIETFIHGALCISYSGQCLFSSMVGARSGNRGKCAGPCRLPYELIEKDKEYDNLNSTKKVDNKNAKYILSTKDLCGLNHLKNLINAGVMCFKIEGRMKTPEYVATVTRIYRKYIDLALSNQPYEIDDKDIQDLLQVFNRGGFSNGHFDAKPNKDLVYSEKPNNMGIYIGNIANINQNKGHVFVNLTNDVSISDTIEFEKETTKYTISELMYKGKNIPSANKGKLVEIGRMKGNLHIGDKIYKTSSKELSNFAKASYENENKKILLNAKITLRKNEPIILNVSTCNNENNLFDDIHVSFTSDNMPVEAKSRPLDEERIILQLNKTNDTIFTFNNIEVDLEDNLFLPSIKDLNELRRNTLNEIMLIAESRILRHSPSISDISFKAKKETKKQTATISVLLNILDESKDYTKLKNIDNVYIPLKYFYYKKYEEIIKNISSKFNTYIYLPTIIKANYTNILKNIIDNSIDNFNIKGFVVSNIAHGNFIDTIIKKYKDRFEFIGNYTLNIYNNNSEKEYKELGISKLTISPELNKETIDDILKYSCLDQEIIVYGRTPLMSMNYCLLGKTNKCYPSCGVRCKENKEYYLKDRLRIYF